MKSTRPILNAVTGRWGSAVLWVGVAVALAALAVGGCTTERHYRVLSFFFDGVPDPNNPQGQLAGEGGPGASGSVARVVTYVHKPYVDNQCGACHSGTLSSFESFQKVSSDVCSKCHQDVLTQFPVMHGPVVAMECLFCHDPHESTVPGMLNQPAPAVCVRCHDRDLLSPNPPEHLAADSQCLQCHVGHGSPKRNLLRVDTTIPKLRVPPPITQPMNPAALPRASAASATGGGA